MTFTVAQILHGAFDILTVLAGIVTLAFYYHWGRFSPSHLGAIVTIIVYTGGTVVLISGMWAILSTL